ncbi:uncharacterized protein LOC112600257 [Melanaphis sacchari]|uniref:uncharacterized protein LOC112600257 n=1 Tax=Melanaphis sacchari TaxID=742174 RepID=UPI000DC13025|nr:uncharacterized protein LOC112600257 [Melanaphis sacchari]
MVGISKANDINSSDYYTYTPYEQDKGLHYENLGPVRIIGAEYKLITYFSLKEYNAKYEILGEKMKNCKFLREICTMRKNKDFCPIVYLDETWVNQNHSRSVASQHNTNMVGPKIPTGKGGRLIVVHAGCAKYGFIPNSKLVFRSNTGNSTDYHSQMNSELFKSWFTQMLNNLEEPSVIIMDNASYHSTLIDNYPKSNTKKADVQEWLTKKNIKFSPLETLAELKMRVKALIPNEKKYELDQLALEMDHEVIRLPPYHCQYNPIELIWAQVKGQVAKNNKTFKMCDIERLTHEALDSVTQHDWEKCARHAEELQDKDNEKEIMRDAVF